MVVKKQKRRKKQSNHVTLRAHHAKPYRKRHVGLLLICVAGFAVLAMLLVQYRDQVIAGVTSSRNFVMDLVSGDSSYKTTLQSTFGFSLMFDTNEFYVNAIDGSTGKMHRDGELTQRLPYTTVQLAPYSVPHISDQSALSINYHPEIETPLSATMLDALAFEDAGIKEDSVQLVATNSVVMGGKTFKQTVWQTKEGDGPFKSLRSSFSLYTANINGHPLTITISEGFVSKPGTHKLYDKLLQSLRFDGTVATANAAVSKRVSTYRSSTPSLLDVVLMSHAAAAADQQNDTAASGQIAALYSPAVVKVFNLYCMDILYNNQRMISNACSGSTGSGFFVSQDGYVATNGHVASANTRDIAIYNAYMMMIIRGDQSIMGFLTAEAGVKESDIASLSRQEAQGYIIDKMYSIDESRFSKTNDVQNLFVALSDKQPDLEEMMRVTRLRQTFKSDSTLAPAVVKADNFRMMDGFDGFRASDVAIIKVEGKNFPVVRMGSFEDVTQGDNLVILGFPGKAGDNGLVDSETTVATLTTGKVSAKKKVEGSDKMVVETDTTIGHGNSGGPAFADGGSVIGIATYSVDGSGSGNGTFNYIRDIKDLKDLAASKSISFDTNSETQVQWEEGMKHFYTAHYSKALPYFDKVKELYPNHNKVAEFTATANKRIAEGLDVKDFPVVPVVIGAAVLLLGAGAVGVVILKHRKKHAVYKAGVAQGSVTPMARGMSPQVVAVAPPPVQSVVSPAAPSTSTAPPASPAMPSTLTPQPSAPVASQPVAPSVPDTSTTPVTPAAPVVTPPATPQPNDGSMPPTSPPQQ